MECVPAKPGYSLDPRILQQIPDELVQALLEYPDHQRLDQLALAALKPTYTNKLLSLLEPVFVDIASRWLVLDLNVYFEQVVSGLSRILPFCPYLRSFAIIVLRSQNAHLPLISQPNHFDITDVKDEPLLSLLLSVFRILSFDPETFSTVICPNQLQVLFSHPNGVIRYMAIRCFCLCMYAADGAMEEMITNHCASSPLNGEWENQPIDYKFLSLWEEERWKHLEIELHHTRKSRDNTIFESLIKSLRDTSYVAEIGGVLIPTVRRDNDLVQQSTLVETPTVQENLHKVGHALLSTEPILLIGQPGSGKTSLVMEAAHQMGHASSMITLHLNEQTDSKSLLGIYSTSSQHGSFCWQPGVLTQAAKEGRWILIEDLDRAPPDVISVILPLVENRELVIPSRREHIRCAAGFRVIATMRSTVNSRGEEVSPINTMLGNRLWNKVRVAPLPMADARHIINKEFPLLQLTRYSDVFLKLYNRIISFFVSSVTARGTQSRQIGLRDLMKFCARVELRLRDLGVESGQQSVPESTDDEIFMDAVDCFAAYLSSEHLRLSVTSTIAEELHVSPQRMRYCLLERIPAYSDLPSGVVIGREFCPKMKTIQGTKSRRSVGKQASFAATKASLRTMEQAAAALQKSEPILLVGETGIGKTAVVQQLATLMNQRITVVNLSQQSETTDLLGGYKPVNLRSIAIPLIDEFNFLFESTFSVRKNQKFLSSVSKSTSTGNWQRLVKILNEAIKMTTGLFETPSKSIRDNQAELEAGQPVKRRKLDTPKYNALAQRWQSFAAELKEFEARVSQGDTKFSFAFVQGKIVKALKNGEWVLLDEINLASPDTLESIASLLHYGRDGAPSVLLSEAGEVERVVGNPGFRIFGAMNPATDAGKRDLAPGLRSRFTEIYVQSPDSDFDDLVTLVKSYLGPLINRDQLVASALSSLYLETKKLNAENKLTDGAGQKPHFSIRTLVRALMYVTDQAHVYGIRRAVYEGFCMSFLTLLSKSSESLIIPLLEKHILGKLGNSRSVLSQTPREPDDGAAYVQFKHYWMRKGELVPQTQSHYIITPFIERNLMNLVRASSTRRFPILLQGPTSSGKTSMVEHLAKLSGNRFVRINNHEHTDLQEYLGSYVTGEDGSLKYQEGVLVEALREGYWIVLDELNLAPTDVLEALNRLLDDNRELFIPETQVTVRPHRNFMLFATQNPAGLYGGRKVLSRAFRNRFLELHFDDIPEDELEFILKERSQIPPSFCTRIVNVYRQLSVLRQSNRLFEQRNSFATLRDLFRWALRHADDREQLAIHGYMLLTERVRNPQEHQAVKEVIEKVMRVKLDEKSIYSSSSLEARLTRLSAPALNNIVWTQAMRRLFTLVSEAIEHNEPVLLVGETGCGKTQLCQAIAEAYGKELFTINAHVNLETGDLIGAQRPLRNRSAVIQQLEADLTFLLNSVYPENSVQDSSLDDLKTSFNALSGTQLDGCDKELLNKIQKNLARENALFEWSDGSLVTAMKAGQHFLLDEMSLADDSVLERLNSVLEPSRTLLLAEKGPSDSLVTAADGFQFLATMNPGGDYGKRELSAALRNRLTEIWVPNLSDDEDILPILEAKVHSTLHNTPTAMMNFAKWFKERVQGSSSSSISIRDLLAWANFVNGCDNLDAELAVVHGACLVYIDALGANPSALLATSSGNLEKDRVACLEKLGTLFNVDAVSIYSRASTIHVEKGNFRIGDFSLPTAPGSSIDPKFALNAPTTLSNTLRIARGLQSSKPLLLEGSPGVGKTTLVAALAQILGKPLTRINLSEQTDLTDLFGSDIPVEGGGMGTFAWSDAPFLRAMQQGGWVLLDEMNLASQSVLEGLNSCLDHRQQVYVAELDQTFRRHPDFFLFATQNPHHQGGGRKGLPASFVNRFTVVYADSFTAHDLQLICQSLSPTSPADQVSQLVEFVTSLNNSLQNDRRLGTVGAPWEVNLRDLARWLQLLDATPERVSPSQFIDVVIRHRFRTSQDRAFISRLYHDTFGTAPATKSYFHNLSPLEYQVGFGKLERDQVLHYSSTTDSRTVPCDLQIAESIMFCVENGWPCLLVGPSGSGKTTTVRKLAALKGARLVELALNSDTDAMDLIGGFEQRDNHRQLSTFMDELTNLLQNHVVREYAAIQRSPYAADLVYLHHKVKKGSASPEALLKPLFNMTQLHSDARFHDLYERCKTICDIQDANDIGFEWTEGLLIHAMQQGHWVVLDNANLCNSSVLDRLNSLMEPDGCLIINEQKTADGSAKIVKPHPNFRLFLTVDPRHGELSRAMRNRAVEIFLLSDQPRLSEPSAITYPCESSIYRVRVCHNLIQEQSSVGNCAQSLGIAFDHLSPKDVISIYDSINSMKHLWGRRPDVPIEAAVALVARYRSMLEHNALVGWPENVVGDSGPQSRFLNIRQSIQPLNPLVNEPRLLKSFAEKESRVQVVHLAKLQEFQLETLHLHEELSQVGNSATTKKSSEMNRLERSMTSKSIHAHLKDSTQPLSAFLFNSSETLASHLRELDSSVPGNVLQMVGAVLKFCWDIFHLSQQKVLDNAVFLTYLQVGKAMCSGFQYLGSSFVEHFSQMLSTFHANWRLISGQSMQRLWNRWRPATPNDPLHLDQLLKFQELCSRFDQMVLGAGIPFVELSQLYDSLLQAQTSMLLGADSKLLVPELSQMVDDLESQSPNLEARTATYFSAEFEGICQYSEFMPPNGNSKTGVTGGIALLAGRPSRPNEISPSGNPVPQLLSKISRFSGFLSTSYEPIALFGTICLSLLEKLTYVGRVPLCQLELLGLETKLLGKGIASISAQVTNDQLALLQKNLVRILEEFLVCHEDLIEGGSLSSILQYLQSTGIGNPVQMKSWKVQLREGCAEYETFRDFLTDGLPKCLSIVQKSRDTSHDYTENGGLCIRLAMSLLRCFVPNRPFDPSLSLAVEHQRYMERLREKSFKLDALRTCEEVFSGQSSSLRIEVAKDELEHLGIEPPQPAVTRSLPSKLEGIQAQFTIILSSILSKSAEEIISLSQAANTSESAVNSKPTALPKVLLQQNIRQICHRLSKNYRGYDDITVPAVRFLELLDLGITLVRQGHMSSSSGSDLVRNISQITPFLGHISPGIPWANSNQAPLSSPANIKMEVHRISVLGASQNIDKGTLSEPSHQEILRDTLSRIYRLWKEQLQLDQSEELEKANLYRYRGSFEDDQHVDAEEINQLFPSYDNEDEPSEMVNSTSPRAGEFVTKLASAFRDLFRSDHKELRLKNLVKESSHLIASITQNSSGKVTTMATKQHLPAVLLMLEDVNSTNSSKPYNFYEDPNIPEIGKLAKLVEKVQGRFSQIRKSWPEHATLTDVVNCCSEIFKFEHHEPLAKFLTKAEKLHSYIYEWQSVASKEFSAVDYYNDLTSLLISWRRLELSTWSRLLDIEDEKCQDGAASWWFIAYEVIIDIPLQLLHDGQKLAGHIRELISTLEKFISSTPLGQFSSRLELIERFESLLQFYLSEFPALGQLAAALVNLHRHYAPFLPVVDKILREGRQTLEKGIKEQIQLASWKDTNIAALRESARRSHNKLFRVIRKYRALLGQTCGDLSAKGTTDANLEYKPVVTSCLVSPNPASVAALDVCRQHKDLWNERPARFKELNSTMKNMRFVYESALPEFQAATQLESMMDDVIESISDFKKQTPKTFTEENKEEIQHLKIQKHRFYAEKLRDLRHMGIRSNLGTDLLDKQASVTIVLADTPNLLTSNSFPQVESADAYFHQFLHLIPSVRQAARDYSEDLSNVEAGRSAGFLEGFLYQMSKQRESIAPALNALASFERVLKTLDSVCGLDKGSLRRNHLVANQRSLQSSVRWLPTIIGLCATVLDIHGKHADIDYSDMLTCLTEWKETVDDMEQRLEKLPSFPSGISSQQHEHESSQAEELVSKIRSGVMEYIHTRPEAAFALEQLLSWTEFNIVSGLEIETKDQNSVSVLGFDSSLTTAMNKILVALQRVNSCLSGIPTSMEDTAWLTRADQLVSKALFELHMPDIASTIESILTTIDSISTFDDDAEIILAIMGTVLPIMQQYQSICIDMVNRYTYLHREVCKLSYVLAKSFKQIASEGFCNPPESSTEQGKSEKLESGTGLGEGEGAEDISKDVQDDEDLSELAQQEKQKEEETDDIEGTDDAVNMDQEELNADSENFADKDEEKEDDEEGGSDQDDENDLDEEAGSVDGWDSAAVDEKLWDGKNDEDQKDTENNEGKGLPDSEDKSAAADQQKAKDEGDDEASKDEDELSEAPDEEGEAIGREDMDVTDPHADENEVLDLPEDIELDGQQKEEEQGSDIDDGMSDNSLDDNVQPDDQLDDRLDETEEQQEGSVPESPPPDVEMDETEDNSNEPDAAMEGDQHEPETEPDNVDEQDQPDIMEMEAQDQSADTENAVPSEAIAGGGEVDQKDDEGASGDAMANKPNDQPNKDDQGENAADQGENGKQSSKESGGKDEGSLQDSQLQTFKKLGNILEEWHKSQREINEASEKEKGEGQEENINMEDAEFEHVVDDQEAADTQALGQADEEQSQAINQTKAIESNINPQDSEYLPDAEDPQDVTLPETLENLMELDKATTSADRQPLTSLSRANDQSEYTTDDLNGQQKENDDVDDVDTQLSAIHLSSESAPLTPADEAQRLWAHYESITHDLSLSLTEQLRLILAPTMATKLRGDFRTGKRLNIKRIIPYIASQFKRDKIWMRRSVPSKRNYQIMLAVDDSKSMLESASGKLAFQTLALVARSLSMLEAGDLCVVSFGNEEHIRVAHEFGKPFSHDAGSQIFQHFSYKQTGTNVRQLIADSTTLFREARAKRTSTSNSGDLWQLQLIISDGICEDHDGIRRLVRQAHEERIMIVFIIVDAVQEESRSIMNLTQATFESDGSGTGEGRWKMKKYLDGFPFAYYLVVRNVEELPAVLSLALKQWFAEVVEVSS